MIDSEKNNRPAELATNKKNNLLPNDSDDTNDLADIVRHAMIKIKADQCGASKQWVCRNLRPRKLIPKI